MQSRMARSLAALVALAALAPLGAEAQTPKKGGVLNFAVVAEPPTSDCHATTTFAMVHPVAPQYSTLLQFTGPHDNQKIEGPAGSRGAGGCPGWQQVWMTWSIDKSLKANEFIGVRVWVPSESGKLGRLRVAYDVVGDFPAGFTVPEK